VATCRQIESLTQGYIDGEVSDSERLILEEHVSGCRVCDRVLKRHKQSTALLYETFEAYRLIQDLSAPVMAHLPEMDRAPLTARTVREVNWRAKHETVGMSRLLRLLPALAPVLIVGLALAIFYSWPQNGHAPTESIGMVMFCQGEVSRSSEAGLDPQGVDLSSPVAAGDRFETGNEAAMMLSLAGPTAIKVAANTRVKIHNERRISVERGRAWLHVGKDVRLFRVNTAMGDAVVFGTTFDVRVEQGMTVVTVADGCVQVETDVAFRELNAGEQATLRIGKRPLDVLAVDALAELAWAEAIVPDGNAQLAFADTVAPKSPAPMAAEQFFVVQTNGRAVQSLTFEWKPAGDVANTGGYYVYVYDDQMSQLFSDHVRAEFFQIPDRRSVDVVVPGDPLRDVRVLHIKVVPDGDAGESETVFTKVSAWGIYP